MLFKGDKVLWAIFILLSIVSAVAVYSSIGLYAITENYTTPEKLFAKHVMFIVMSYVAVIVLSNLKYGVLKKPSAVFFAIAFGLSAITLMMGTRWFRFGGHSIQPSEFLKLATIMILAWHLDAHRDQLGTPKMLGWWIGIAGLSALVIFGLNFSTAALLFLSCLMMMYFIGADKKWWWRIFGITMLIGVLGLLFFLFFGDDIEFFRATTW